jgi:sec-independent protein translocase protein TatA
VYFCILLFHYMGTTEIIFIFVIYLLLFGSKGIPSLAKTMGEGVRHFRSATDEIQREILKGTDNISRDFKKATDLRSKPQSADSKNKPEKKEAQESKDDRKETRSDS